MPDPLKTGAALNPALVDLQPLIGRWAVKITWSEQTHKLVGGPSSVQAPASFERFKDGGFLVHTIGGDGAPLAHWMIGRDETSGAFAVLYSDSRGVSRTYEMSLAGNVWKIWRNAPGFHQRFTGRISPDQRSIEACWEKSANGTTWETDFDLNYTKTE
jgi:hypothetical protein